MSEEDSTIINQEGLDFNPAYRQAVSSNPMLNTHFKFTLTRIPNVTFWCTSTNIPSVSIGDVSVPNKFISMHVPGSTISIDRLRVEFIIDEDFTNWVELYRWMRNLVPFENFREIIAPTENYYSDGIIHCLNSAKNPNINFIFKKMFPVSIEGFDLNSAFTDSEPIKIRAEFAFESFDMEVVT
jgi:hypothetical protein